MRATWLFLLVGLAMSASAASLPGAPPSAACTRNTQGRYWPEDANSDKELAKKLMRSGDLQMCVLGFWRYKWEPLTVSYQSLASSASLDKKARHQPANASSDADSTERTESAER